MVDVPPAAAPRPRFVDSFVPSPGDAPFDVAMALMGLPLLLVPAAGDDEDALPPPFPASGRREEGDAAGMMRREYGVDLTTRSTPGARALSCGVGPAGFAHETRN